MARRRSGKRAAEAEVAPNGATVGHEAELWAMADALRGSMDAAEYKHVVLGLIFLKYISDAFEERHAAVLAEFGEDAAEDRDEYTAENIFWVPREARWTHLKAQARQSTVGLTVDQAMAAILFIDARKLGRMVDRTHRELTDDDIARIAGAYHAWRDSAEVYEDLAGFCKSAPLDEVRRHGHVLTPGRYVGAEPQPDDGEPFEAKMRRLVAELQAQQAEGARLDAAIAENLKRLRFGGDQ